MFAYLLLLTSSARVIASVTYDAATDHYQIIPNLTDATAAATAIYIDENNWTGNYYLQIETPQEYNESVKWYAAGMLEGFLGGRQFRQAQRNVISTLCAEYIQCNDDGTLPSAFSDWASSHYDNVVIAVKPWSNPDDQWQQTGLNLLNQLNGIVAGYNAANEDVLTIQELWLWQSHPAFHIIARASNFKLGKPDAPLFYRRGTAIVGRNTSPDNVYIGQSAIRHYADSVKVGKRYRFRRPPNRNGPIERRHFTSAPFLLCSDDPFQITDQGILVVGSYLAYNDSTIQVDNHYFPFWWRSTVATSNARTAPEWYGNYSRADMTQLGNTPAIEYLIVDLKQFSYKNGFLADFVWAVDELPPHIVASPTLYGQDLTPQFRANRYLASYDIPNIDAARDYAGYDALADSDTGNPDLYSYTSSTRAKILDAQARNFFELSELRTLLRLNDPDNIREQRKDPSNAVAPRYENATNPRCYGSADAKVTTIGRALHLMYLSQFGAPSDVLPPIVNLSTIPVCAPLAREGVPENFAFPWVSNYFDLDDTF